MFIKIKSNCIKNKCCNNFDTVEMKYIDAGGRESCAENNCFKHRCDKCNSFKKTC